MIQGLPESASKEGILRFIPENDVRILNLCHIPQDARLKTLSFDATNHEKVDEVLESGERVDGSSLFSFLEPGKSDIFIQPRPDTAFINPFSKTLTLNVLCDYLDADGNPLQFAPQNALERAEKKLLASSGITLRALAELEFYVISKRLGTPLFPASPDGNYHESSPFTRFEDLRNEIISTLSSIGIPVKYGHSEVGRLADDNDEFFEQHEIELSPQNLTRMAESVAVSKWAIRNVCAKYEVSVSFAPKISLEHAGTGMHVHLCAMKGRRNVVADQHRSLSNEAQKIIGGILKFAPSLSAFANPTPVSYMRFIARKESPMHICWSYRNRLALIRIPSWPRVKERTRQKGECKETFEYRASDALANPYLLFAGLALAADYGLAHPQEALGISEHLRVDDGDPKQRLKTLPFSCSDSADKLERDRQFYETDDVFPSKLIDKTIESLRFYKDVHLWQELKDKPTEAEKVLKQYRHFG
jgi:glutamine synthetase